MTNEPGPTEGLDLLRMARLQYGLANDALASDKFPSPDGDLELERTAYLEVIAYATMSAAASLLKLLGEKEAPKVDLEKAIGEALELVEQGNREHTVDEELQCLDDEAMRARGKMPLSELYGTAAILEPYSVEHPPSDEGLVPSEPPHVVRSCGCQVNAPHICGR